MQLIKRSTDKFSYPQVSELPKLQSNNKKVELCDNLKFGQFVLMANTNGRTLNQMMKCKWLIFNKYM